MNKIICSNIEIIPVADIKNMYGENIDLQPGKKFLQLTLEKNAEYTADTTNENPGTQKTETITASVMYGQTLSDYLAQYKYYIVKLYTDSETFLLGSPAYPAELTLSTNKIRINLTFKAKSTPE